MQARANGVVSLKVSAKHGFQIKYGKDEA